MMKFYDLRTGRPLSSPPDGCIYALGNFDGVHIGHRALLRAVSEERERAPELFGAVWTFDRHPDPRTPLLCGSAERLTLFGQAGMDYAVTEEFSAVRDFTPEAFVRDILCRTLRCRGIVCGFNFHFGAGGRGDAEMLSHLLREENIPCRIVDEVQCDRETVSSSRIRRLLANGKPEEAALCLGRPFSFSAPVIHGRHLGSVLQFPTVNQILPEGLVQPAYGVYLTAVRICADGTDSLYYGVTNFGIKPTVGGDSPVCETNLPRYEGDLYGETVQVFFLKFIRPEARFTSIEELKSAIARDVDTCRVLTSDFTAPIVL